MCIHQPYLSVVAENQSKDKCLIDKILKKFDMINEKEVSFSMKNDTIANQFL